MSKSQQLSVGWARLVFDLLEREGLNASDLFRRFDLDDTQLSNPQAYFSQDSFTRLWHEASRLTDNPAIGLKMADNPNITAFDSLSYNLMSCATIRESLERTVRYQKLVGSAAQIALEYSQDGCHLIFDSWGDELPVAHQGFDAGLALNMFSVRFITNQHLTPVYAEFRYSQPDDLQPYRDLFQCPLYFSRDRYSLCLKEEDIDLPIIFANKDMAALHDKTIKLAIEQLDDESLATKVRELICQKLPSGEPSIQSAAECFNLSQRTLQRRLKTEGFTYLSLIDNTRKELAHSYICQQSLSFQEVTFLLGFNDHSNFYRAFKRWYGCTPGEYREKSQEPH